MRALRLSSGDPVATPAQVNAVMKSMKSKGFLKIRLESYAGADGPLAEQIKIGLNWFVDEAKKSGSDCVAALL